MTRTIIIAAVIIAGFTLLAGGVATKLDAFSQDVSNGYAYRVHMSMPSR
ncbi:MAG: hypothetical protein G8345_00745 [Magnetococcales bacterium]|nr:hypothetical protein [Magnetococcales bacterium]NGZ25396.1 hypothetical protein [Magnetococcales bacterium]